MVCLMSQGWGGGWTHSVDARGAVSTPGGCGRGGRCQGARAGSGRLLETFIVAFPTAQSMATPEEFVLKAQSAAAEISTLE